MLDAQEREHDNALVLAAQSGDRAAFGDLVDRLKRSVHGVCMSYLRNEAEAMDAVQDTFLKAWTEPGPFSYRGKHYQFDYVNLWPRPVQTPHPPIHVGGESDVAIRRVVRLGADWLPFTLSPALLVERRARLAELLEPTGRSIDDVYITASPNRDSARGELATLEAWAAA